MAYITDLPLNKLSEETFHSTYASQPFVWRGAAKDWIAFNKWTPDFFKRKCPSETVSVTHLRKNEIVRMTVFEFFQNHFSEKSKFYLKDWEFKDKMPELCQDYVVPSFFKSWLESSDYQASVGLSADVPKLSWLYIGGAGTGSGLHKDVLSTSAWNAVISGRKEWIFFPPTDDENLYGLNFDAFSPDLARMPLLAKTNPSWCIQEAGDIVFTPSDWAHQVRNVKTGISLTENFVNASNAAKVTAAIARERLAIDSGKDLR